jgi:hypothetical protein
MSKSRLRASGRSVSTSTAGVAHAETAEAYSKSLGTLYVGTMLQDVDLKAFLNAFAKSDDPLVKSASPRDVLERANGLFSAEIWRLGCSLQIAAILGDTSQEAAAAIQIILHEVKEVRCAALEDHDAWCQAIAWARMQPAIAEAASLEVPTGREREVIVAGLACGFESGVTKSRSALMGHRSPRGLAVRLSERSRRSLPCSAALRRLIKFCAFCATPNSITMACGCSARWGSTFTT